MVRSIFKNNQFTLFPCITFIKRVGFYSAVGKVFEYSLNSPFYEAMEKMQRLKKPVKKNKNSSKIYHMEKVTPQGWCFRKKSALVERPSLVAHSWLRFSAPLIGRRNTTKKTPSRCAPLLHYIHSTHNRCRCSRMLPESGSPPRRYTAKNT